VTIRFAKGHGTQNDFVLIDDPDGELPVSADAVAALCDRRRGLGADGLIRVVRTAALTDASSYLAGAQAPEWFMDYRNADGSLAQMCGNGVRVFAAHLLNRGWIDLPDGESFSIGTRAGVKTVHRIKDWFGVDLGPWRLTGGEAALAAGSDTEVSVPMGPPGDEPVLLSGLPGLSANLGNPHVVVALPSLDQLEALDLTRHPGVDPLPEEGVNVEFIVPIHDATLDEGHLTMRVHERGVGETRSCGTGAVGAVLAARAWAGGGITGQRPPSSWTVDVPGGRLRVELPDDAGLVAGESAVLIGPAVLVADGVLVDTQYLGLTPR